MRGVGLFILSLGVVSIVSGVVIAALSGLVVLATTIGIGCVLLAAVGVAVVRALRRDRARRLLRATAVITAVVPSRGPAGDGREVVLELEVTTPAGPPYQATVATVVPRRADARCAVGQRVVVWADRDDPSDVTVDWRRRDA